ncbi:MAG: hypothetical protein QM703_11230 [Gemmatales bacterium]
MADRILIRSTESRSTTFLVGGGGLLTIIAAIVVGIVTGNIWLALTLGFIGLILLFAGFFVEAKRVRELMWITLEPNRFTITDNIGERSFNDDDIVSISLQYKDNFDNGNHTSTTRTFRVWVVSSADRPEQIEMKSKIKVGDADPLHGYINRIVKLLKDRADGERLKSLSVLGEGWELTGKTLILRDPKKGETETPLGEIVACMNSEEKLKLWKRGEDESFASVPLDAANAHLLHLFLEEELARRPDQDKGAPPAGQLGRIIFERKPRKSLSITLLVVAGGLALIVGLMFFGVLAGGGKQKELEPVIIIASIMGVISVLLVLAAWVNTKSLFRCHEYGVYQRSIMGEARLLYSEVEAFTYSATRHYHNGAYIGTHLRLAFIPKAELTKSKIVYKTTVKNVDSSLDQMRDEIAKMIGSRMYREVKEGKSVKWNETLTLEPGILRYIPTSLFGKKPPETIAYVTISGHNLQQGTLSLFKRGLPKPIVSTGSTTQNFFPGYFAFMALWEDARANPSPAPVPVAEPEFPDVRKDEFNRGRARCACLTTACHSHFKSL